MTNLEQNGHFLDSNTFSYYSDTKINPWVRTAIIFIHSLFSTDLFIVKIKPAFVLSCITINRWFDTNIFIGGEGKYPSKMLLLF